MTVRKDGWVYRLPFHFVSFHAAPRTAQQIRVSRAHLTGIAFTPRREATQYVYNNRLLALLLLGATRAAPASSPATSCSSAPSSSSAAAAAASTTTTASSPATSS